MTVTEELISYFLYIVQGCIAGYCATTVLTPRIRPIWAFLIQTAAHLTSILVFGIYQGNYNGSKLIVSYLAALIALHFLFKERMLIKALLWTSLILVTFVSEFIIVFLHFMVMGLAMEDMYVFSIRTLWSAISLVVISGGSWLVAVFYRRFFRRLPPALSGMAFFQFALLPASQCVLIWCVLMNITLGVSTESMVVFVAAVTLCLAANIASYRTMVKTARNHELELQLAETEFAAHVQQTEYQAMRSSEQNLARYRHDNKNRLAAISALLRSDHPDAKEQALEMLDSMTQALTVQHGMFCANSVVDATLAVKQSECARHDIRLHHSLLLERELPFESLALCSLFSNLMDNAIRACRSLPAAQRDITLSARVEGGFMLVKLRNPLPGPDAEKGSGLGLKILQQLADRYGGELITGEESGSFVTLVALCVPQPETPEN